LPEFGSKSCRAGTHVPLSRHVQKRLMRPGLGGCVARGLGGAGGLGCARRGGAPLVPLKIAVLVHRFAVCSHSEHGNRDLGPKSPKDLPSRKVRPRGNVLA
jgi:hypothetical protein